jgi:hypothetical protein
MTVSFASTLPYIRILKISNEKIHRIPSKYFNDFRY